jgi:hypothetical protein
MAEYDPNAAKLAADLGYGFSCLDAPQEGASDLDSFMECLNDWGWAPTDQSAPQWYGDRADI